MMKKILIVNNNMEVGGVQKSLYNLLWTVKDDYDITLCLFSKTGEYVDKLPENVKVAECKSLFRYLGVSQGKCSGADKIKRGILAAISKTFGRPAAMKILLLSQKVIPEEYDCAIAYLHNGGIKNFYGGVQDFVIHKTKAKKKIAFLHCDYGNSGANNRSNNALIGKFDCIASCSEGCRNAFCEVLPQLKEKCVTVRNCHRFDEIEILAEKDTVQYDKNEINVVMVSRLAHEKGIERALEAVAYAREAGYPVKLHIIGGGPMKGVLCSKAKELEILEHAKFYGEHGNPFRFIKNADLFMLASYHEAAPMVIEEAVSIGVPVLSTKTTSSGEMITERNCGWVCENTQKALAASLVEIISDKEALGKAKERLCKIAANNDSAKEQFKNITEG